MMGDIGIMIGVYTIVRIIALALRPWHDKEHSTVSSIIIFLAIITALIIAVCLFDLVLRGVPE